MTERLADSETRLVAELDRHRGIVIAVSGGVDSMTLAHAVHRLSGALVTAVHAISPAVPPSATERVRRHAERHGWTLMETDAGEFADRRYLTNPVDRCYFCKTNLYGRIAALTAGVIASGTNLDDLDDYRPGLAAAKEHGVVHPYVAAGFDKGAVRMLARRLELDDLAELPAQPCLASRIETGIPITADDLVFIDAVETSVAALLPPTAAVRCRLTSAGMALEIGAGLATGAAADVAARLCREAGRRFVGVRPYARGASFIRT
jgi:uncharacterized protein